MGRAYRESMDSGRFRRGTIALAAAYALALQAFFAALVPVVAGSLPGTFAILCSHDAGDGSGQPVQHELPCAAVCAAMGHSFASAVPPEVVAAIALPYVIAGIAPVSEWVPPQIAPTDTHAPRGPPLA